MRGRSTAVRFADTNGNAQEQPFEQLSAQHSCSSLNPLDQAFIVYSDEDVISRSSHSYHSDSRSISFSNRSRASQLSHKSNYSNGNNILDQLANEESSIYDVRESECSESCKELLHELEPLFGNKNFLRRSPRFVNHNQPLYAEALQVVEKPFKVKKALPPMQVSNNEMIEDQKYPLNQNTQIVQQKQENHLQHDHTMCNSSLIIPSLQKLIESEPNNQPQIFPSLRQTRSSIKAHFESESTRSNNSQLATHQSTSEYLSTATKEFIISLKKQKKIKKRLKEKSSGQKTRQYNLRHHH